LVEPLYQSTRGEDRHPSYKSRPPRSNVLKKVRLRSSLIARLVSATFLTGLKKGRFNTQVGGPCDEG